MADSVDSGPHSLDNRPWGWLHPARNARTRSVRMTKTSYSFGRLINCDYTFYRKEFEDELLFSTISSQHFLVERDGDTQPDGNPSVYITDKSSNGTFLNGKRMEKEKKEILRGNDIIALSTRTNEVFVFINAVDWIPIEHNERYEIKMTLQGTGSFGEYRMAEDKKKMKNVAMTKIKKNEGFVNSLSRTEVLDLQNIKHVSIVAMEDYFESSDHIFVVFEFVEGVTLDSKIKSKGPLGKEEAQLIFLQLAKAVEHLSLKDIVHSDITPENVLITPHRNEQLARVTDLGLRRITDDPKSTQSTRSFPAPEILCPYLGDCSNKVDVWGLGVSLFYCLSAEYPFSEKWISFPRTDQIVRGLLCMDSKIWRRISFQSHHIKPLIRQMLAVKPDQRISVTALLRDEWFQDPILVLKYDSIVENVMPKRNNHKKTIKNVGRNRSNNT